MSHEVGNLQKMQYCEIKTVSKLNPMLSVFAINTQYSNITTSTEANNSFKVFAYCTSTNRYKRKERCILWDTDDYALLIGLSFQVKLN
jgi:hypothetical protein